MLAHRLRRCTNIKTTLVQRLAQDQKVVSLQLLADPTDPSRDIGPMLG